jgi:hypothetical protein
MSKAAWHPSWSARPVISLAVALTGVASLVVGAGPAGGAPSAAVAHAANPNPCALVTAARVALELGMPLPTVARTTVGTPSDPVLVCTYAWGPENMIIRFISDLTETQSGGLHEAGMGPHGLLVAGPTFTQVAFTKGGWSVWLVVNRVVPPTGLVALGRLIYAKVRWRVSLLLLRDPVVEGFA